MEEQQGLSVQPKKEEKKAPVDSTVGEAVRNGEVVLPGTKAELAKVEPAEDSMAAIDLTQSIPARAFQLDAAAIEVIRQLKCPGASKVEVAWFLYQCHALGLNPLLPGQISFAAYDGDDGDGGKERRRVVMVEIGGLRLLALRSQLYRQGDPPVFEWDEKTKLPKACTVSLFRKEGGQWIRHERRYLWEEFSMFHGRKMWRKSPSIMFAKTCEANLIRFYFPDGTSGVYIPEEIIDVPQIGGLMGEAQPPKQSVYDRAMDLLRVAEKKYRVLGVDKPKGAAVALARKVVPQHESTSTWTAKDADAFEEAVRAIVQEPPADVPAPPEQPAEKGDG